MIRNYMGELRGTKRISRVPYSAYRQVRWERDLAVSQLTDYGVGLGEKTDVKKVIHARWMNRKEAGKSEIFWNNYICSNCMRIQPFGMTCYCPACGAKMDGEQQ